MRAKSWGFTLACCVLTLGFCTKTNPSFAGSETGIAKPVLEYSDSPDQVVLEFSIHGMQFFGENVPHVRILGNNQVEVFRPIKVRKRSGGGFHPTGHFRMFLPSQEVDNLLQFLAQERILDLSSSRINRLKRDAEQEYLDTHGSKPERATDSSGYLLKVHLERYQLSSLEEPQDDFALSLLVSDAKAFAKRYPNHKEFKTLVEVAQRFRELMYDDKLIAFQQER